MTTTRMLARRLALPLISAGILGGAVLGLAGTASAGTYSYQPEPRPGIVATPNIIARPPTVIIHRHHYPAGDGLVIDAPAGD